MNKNTNIKKLIDSILHSKGEEVKLGVDVHARDVVVALQVDGSLPQRGRRMKREQLVSLTRTMCQAGLKVHVVQEAGPCGYGLHRELAALGAASHVMAPEILGDARKQKTDALDAVALVDRLDRYVRGNTHAMSVIRVPTPEEEQRRERGRLRDQLKDSRQRWEARGRSLMLAQDHHITGAWWKPGAWKALRPTLPAWLAEELEVMRTILLALHEQEKERLKQLQEAVSTDLPKGVGALSWERLSGEVCDWERFSNRRQVASYTGLCPGVHQSGGTHRDGSINRHGNPRVRFVLVQMVWRLVRFQPDYPPVRKLVEGVVRGAARRKLVVAAARRLAIDLWRLATEQTTPQNLHLIMAKSTRG